MTFLARCLPHRPPVRAVAATAAVLLAVAAPSGAQVQSRDQQKCITKMNKAGAKVAGAQGKENSSCVKNAGKGKEPDATACLGADTKGKVGKAVAKSATTFTKSCATLPDFGPSDGTTIADAGRDEMTALATDLFGGDLTGVLVPASTSSDAAKCQSAVIKNEQKLARLIIKSFNKCKANGLKDETIDSAARLSECVATVDADVKGKLAKITGKIDDTLRDTCEGLDGTAMFPGACADYTSFGACVVSLARCRACSVLSVGDGFGNACDRFDDDLPGNASCGGPVVVGERVSLASPAEPADTPGSPGVVVTNPKLLTQFPPSGPDLNRADYLRLRLGGPDIAPDLILVLVPGFGAGVNIFRILAEDLIPKLLADEGLRLEIWAFSRRDDLLEDRAGAILATDLADPEVAQDWYYGTELGLSLHPALVSGPGRRAVFYNSSDDIPFLANFTPLVFSRDLDVVVDAARAVVGNNVFLGGHSAGTGFAARYAATDFNLSGIGSPVPGYGKLAGLVLLEGGGGSAGDPGSVSTDSIDRMIAKADGGLFGAVRDDAPRCVDGTTPCTIATEAVDCALQVPPKCTEPVTSYASIGGLQPQLYAAGEVGGVQGIRDPESGQLILQVDQGAPGNNAIAQVPGLSPLLPPTIVDATVEGLFGIFLDDDGVGALLSPALATSLGTTGPYKNGLLTWIDIDGDGFINASARPNNGPAPTTLPGTRWGQEVEVTRMDRHRMGFIAGGENSSDWYYAGSGLSTLSISGLCSGGTCAAGKSGSCSSNGDCSQSFGLDTTPLSATRPDIANMTQVGSIDIPVICFGGSNGLTPVPGSYVAFANSIGTCAAASCDGTARVVDDSLPSEAFPTYGDIAGGYEVYISEGYAHVDVVTAEDTDENMIPERLAAFLVRNLEP